MRHNINYYGLRLKTHLPETCGRCILCILQCAGGGQGAAVYNIQRFIESFTLQPADLWNLDLAKNSGRYDVTFWPLPWVAMHWKVLQVHWHGPWRVWKNPGLLFGIARCVCLVSLCLFHYGHCEMSWSILVLHHELMKCAHCWSCDMSVIFCVLFSTDNPRRVSQSCCSYEWLQWDIITGQIWCTRFNRKKSRWSESSEISLGVSQEDVCDIGMICK